MSSPAKVCAFSLRHLGSIQVPTEKVRSLFGSSSLGNVAFSLSHLASLYWWLHYLARNNLRPI